MDDMFVSDANNSSDNLIFIPKGEGCPPPSPRNSLNFQCWKLYLQIVRESITNLMLAITNGRLVLPQSFVASREIRKPIYTAINAICFIQFSYMSFTNHKFQMNYSIVSCLLWKEEVNAGKFSIQYIINRREPKIK